MSPANSDASMLAVAVSAPLRPTLLAVDSCTHQHANLLVSGQIVSGLVTAHVSRSPARLWWSESMGPQTNYFKQYNKSYMMICNRLKLIEQKSLRTTNDENAWHTYMHD
jgi:hypothetical protein